MANNRDLLKEAIADAKAVKETAIANAKAALEEAFTPYLKEKFSAKLAEMEDMDEEIEEAVTNEAKKEVEERLGTINDPDSREPHGNLEEEEMDEEMYLDEILAELEGLDEEKDDMNEAEGDEAEEGEEDEEAEGEEAEGEDEEIDLEEMSEEDLKKFIEDVIEDMVAAGELEAGDEFEAEGEEAEGEEEIDIEDETEEIMEGEKEDIDEADAVSGVSDAMGILLMAAPAIAAAVGLSVAAVKDKLEKGGAEAKALVKQAAEKAKSMEEGEDVEEGYDVDEMKKEIEELKSDLNEVNLLNAKLLYVNKIFKAKNLSEANKAKVLEAFDKAKTVKETKLVFETLSENLTSKKEVVKESLGRASKPMGVAPTAKKPILEANNQVARWQKLAGIIKS
jgi:hypothetical protein